MTSLSEPVRVTGVLDPGSPAYLDDPYASPGRQCLTCQLPLPERWGHFVERATGKRTYGPLRYFATCPGCGGTAIKLSFVAGTEAEWAKFPLRPDERYDFKEQSDFSPVKPWGRGGQ